MHANLLPTTTLRTAKAARQTRWRRDKVDTAAGRKAFRAVLKKQHAIMSMTHNNASVQERQGTCTVQRQADELDTIINTAAQASCGKMHIVPNLSAPWMAHDSTGMLRPNKKSRRALLDYKIASAWKHTPQHILDQLKHTFETTWRQTKDLIVKTQNNHKKSMTKSVNEHCEADPSSHKTARAIDKAAGVQQDRNAIFRTAHARHRHNSH